MKRGVGITAITLALLAGACDRADDGAGQSAHIAQTVAPAIEEEPTLPDDFEPLTVEEQREVERAIRGIESDSEINEGCSTVFFALLADIEKHGEAGWRVADRKCRWIAQVGREMHGRLDAP